MYLYMFIYTSYLIRVCIMAITDQLHCSSWNSR